MMRFLMVPWVRAALIVVSAGVVLAGVLAGDVRETIMNASILCFSCIGIK